MPPRYAPEAGQRSAPSRIISCPPPHAGAPLRAAEPSRVPPACPLGPALPRCGCASPASRPAQSPCAARAAPPRSPPGPRPGREESAELRPEWGGEGLPAPALLPGPACAAGEAGGGSGPGWSWSRDDQKVTYNVLGRTSFTSSLRFSQTFPKLLLSELCYGKYPSKRLLCFTACEVIREPPVLRLWL